MNLKLSCGLICVLLVSFSPADAQTSGTGSAVAVEHSVPFGTIPGKLLLLGNYLVFVDKEQPAASFVVAKNTIESLNSEDAAITVQTREAVRNRSGEVRRLSFRVLSNTEPAVITAWYGSGASVTSAPASAAPSVVANSGSTIYNARHNHRFGDCRGRFIIGPDQVSYESLSSVSHSRRWTFRAIKEAALPNPYELEVKPFSGGAYKLRFDGTGMDPAAYKELVDRVALARAGR